MASDNKTLIVLDTNKLRQVLGGSPSYGSFDFGDAFNKIKEFIESNKLEDLIDIGIPDISVQELVQQKVEQYFQDCKEFRSIVSRLSQLPDTDFSGVRMPSQGFECESYLQPSIEDSFKDNNIKVMKLPEESYADIFKEVITRAVKRQLPFKSSNKSSDIGFKDVVLWHTLLSYEISGYSRVLFITADKVFDDIKCKKEFEKKKKRTILISQSVELVIIELKESYADIIKKNEFIEFTNKDYFRDYVHDEMSKRSQITIGGHEWTIKGWKVLSYLDSVDYSNEDDNKDEIADYWILITTKIELNVSDKSVTKKIITGLNTYLDDAMGIQESEIEIAE